MSDKLYVASTLAAAVEYMGFKPQVADNLPTIERSVTIGGGAGVANKRFVTPRGVITPVTREEAEFLEGHYLFQLHKANGYVQILDSKPSDPDEVAADMTGRDNSAPIVPQDYKEDEAPAAVGAKTTGQGGKRIK